MAKTKQTPLLKGTNRGSRGGRGRGATDPAKPALPVGRGRGKFGIRRGRKAGNPTSRSLRGSFSALVKVAHEVKPEGGEEFVPLLDIRPPEPTPQEDAPADEREPRTPRTTPSKATKGQEKGRTIRTRSATQGKKNPRKRPRIESWDEDEEQTTHPETAPTPTLQ